MPIQGPIKWQGSPRWRLQTLTLTQIEDTDGCPLPCAEWRASSEASAQLKFVAEAPAQPALVFSPARSCKCVTRAQARTRAMILHLNTRRCVYIWIILGDLGISPSASRGVLFSKDALALGALWVHVAGNRFGKTDGGVGAAG